MHAPFDVKICRILHQMNANNFLHKAYGGKLVRLNPDQLNNLLTIFQFLNNRLNVVIPVLKSSAVALDDFEQVLEKLAAEKPLIDDKCRIQYNKIVELAQTIQLTAKSQIPQLKAPVHTLAIIKEPKLSLPPCKPVEIYDFKLADLTENDKENRLLTVLEERLSLYPRDSFNPDLTDKLRKTFDSNPSGHLVFTLRNDSVIRHLVLHHKIISNQEIIKIIGVLDSQQLKAFLSQEKLIEQLSTESLKFLLRELKNLPVKTLKEITADDIGKETVHHFISKAYNYLLELSPLSSGIRDLPRILKLLEDLANSKYIKCPQLDSIFRFKIVTLKIDSKDSFYYSTQLEFLSLCKLSSVLNANQLRFVKTGAECYDLSNLNLTLQDVDLLATIIRGLQQHDFLKCPIGAGLDVFKLAQFLQIQSIRQNAEQQAIADLEDRSGLEIIKLLKEQPVDLTCPLAIFFITKMLTHLESIKSNSENFVELYEIYQIIFQLSEETHIHPGDLENLFFRHYPRIVRRLAFALSRGEVSQEDYILQLEQLMPLAHAGLRSGKYDKLADYYCIATKLNELKPFSSYAYIKRHAESKIAFVEFAAQVVQYDLNNDFHWECWKASKLSRFEMNFGLNHPIIEQTKVFENSLYSYRVAFVRAMESNIGPEFCLKTKDFYTALVHYLVDNWIESSVYEKEWFETNLKSLIEIEKLRLANSVSNEDGFEVLENEQLTFDLRDCCVSDVLFSRILLLSKLRVDRLILSSGSYLFPNFARLQREILLKHYTPEQIQWV